MAEQATYHEEINEKIGEAARLLAASEDVLVFTGSGISAESGIPTFRGSEGLWRQYRPGIYGNLFGLGLVFLTRRKRIVSFTRDVLDPFASAVPNPGHEAITRLQRLGISDSVVTQNIDNLHQEAGSRNVLQLHGSIYVARCRRCGYKKSLPAENVDLAVAALDEGSPGRRRLLSILGECFGRCDSCEGRNRPDVVFFGEDLSKDRVAEAIARAGACDCCLAVGTSALVYPAASIPFFARRSGARVVEVNPHPTPVSEIADVVVPGLAGEVLPPIVEQTERLKAERKAGERSLEGDA